MNEEYLHRGKREDNGEWVEGYLIKGNRTYIVTIPNYWRWRDDN